MANNQVTLPNVVGETATQAQATLQALGVTVRRCSSPARTSRCGNVLAMSPPAGTKTTQGATVTLTVGKAPQVAVPALAGQDQVTASNTLQSRASRPQIVPQMSATVPAGKVIGTNPAAGTMLDKGSPVAAARLDRTRRRSRSRTWSAKPGIPRSRRSTGAGLSVQAILRVGNAAWS